MGIEANAAHTDVWQAVDSSRKRNGGDPICNYIILWLSRRKYHEGKTEHGKESADAQHFDVETINAAVRMSIRTYFSASSRFGPSNYFPDNPSISVGWYEGRRIEVPGELYPNTIVQRGRYLYHTTVTADVCFTNSIN